MNEKSSEPVTSGASAFTLSPPTSARAAAAAMSVCSGWLTSGG
jgi:hypothetical protein